MGVLTSIVAVILCASGSVAQWGLEDVVRKVGILRSYDTLHMWHLLRIEQTKIICYNFPDTTASFEKKLLQKHMFIEYVPLTLWLYLPYLKDSF